MSSRRSGNPAADRRHTYAVSYREAGDLEAAAELMAQALELAPRWAAGWLTLGEVLEAGGKEGPAIDAYRQAMSLDPADEAGAGGRLARLGAHPAGGALSPAHVAALFDDYAPRFEGALVGRLGYRGPALLRAALAACRDPLAFRHVIDLGCGTGLMADEMAPFCETMEGVDLSAGMLAVARRKSLYASLAQAEIVALLAAKPDHCCDLVIAADVLVYLGDLGPLFAEAGRALEPAGLLAFTAQTFDGAGERRPGDDEARYRIGRDLRFAHSAGGIRAWAWEVGLRIASLDEAPARLEAGRPVPGLVAILEKPRA